MRLLRHREKTDSQQGTQALGLCRRIRQRVADSTLRRLSPEAAWVQRHAAVCPRCRRRLAAVARVDLALTAIKSQPHQLDLLMRANAAAVRMLNHQLRETEQAHRLEHARPEPCLIERYARHRGTITNIAACIAILFLTKTGIFSSFDKARTRGQAVMKQYYASQAGEDLAREVFNS
jgi:hypothetical protein